MMLTIVVLLGGKGLAFVRKVEVDKSEGGSLQGANAEHHHDVDFLLDTH